MTPSSARPSRNTRNNHDGNSCSALLRDSGSAVQEPTPREATEKPRAYTGTELRWEMDSRCLRPQGAALVRVK